MERTFIHTLEIEAYVQKYLAELAAPVAGQDASESRSAPRAAHKVVNAPLATLEPAIREKKRDVGASSKRALKRSRKAEDSGSKESVPSSVPSAKRLKVAKREIIDLSKLA